MLSSGGGGSMKNFGFAKKKSGSSSLPSGVIRFSSKFASVTEGASSNYETVSLPSGWGYSSSVTDAVTVTTSGVSAYFKGTTIGRPNSGSWNSVQIILRVISGSSTGGSVLKQETVTVSATSGTGSVLVEFSDLGYLMTPGTYTIAMSYPNSLPTNTFYQSGNARSSSSISGTAGALNITYLSSSFSGPSPLNSSNGTSNTGGQHIAMKWIF
jgi:hypothetical protein